MKKEPVIAAANATATIPRLSTVSAMLEKPEYQWLSKQAMRHLIFQASKRVNSKGEKIPTNGLDKSGAIIRLGRKVLIDLDRFNGWVDLHRQKND